MREILFRGKRYSDGEWNYGNLSTSDNREPIIMPKDGTWGYCVIPETVGQYTGLQDVNGKKIFEGDILQCNDNPVDLVKAVFGAFDVIDVNTELAVDEVIGWHYEVIPTDALSKLEPFCFSMPLTKYYIDRCNMKVIGNIHDNPELLGDENDA